MEIKITEKAKNPLFNREEIQAVVEADTIPKNQEAEKLISEKLKIPEQNIKIKRILGKFGSNEFRITANIYASEQDKNKIEPKSKKEKKQVKPEEKPEEKKQETTKTEEEPKAEAEVKEEIKEEKIEELKSQSDVPKDESLTDKENAGAKAEGIN